jgi:transcriptional regulator with XRE-family HTH domain
MALTFGEFVRTRRLELGTTLREFCREHALDAAHMSKVERGLATPVKSKDALEKIALALKLVRGSEKWRTFMDLAAISAGRIPASVTENKRLMASLPLVFRTFDGKPISEEKLRQLAEMIRKA